MELKSPVISHAVRHSSQHQELVALDWHYRGCGIIALKMLMDYWQDKGAHDVAPSAEIILETGLRIGAHDPKFGWRHSGLVAIAKQFGYDGYNYDEPTGTAEAAWSAFTSELAKQPILASVYAKLDPAKGGGHIIVASGLDNEYIYINDPEDEVAHGEKRLPITTFLLAWKKRFIVIHPHDR